MSQAQPELPGVAIGLPEGLIYRPDFISENEERALLAEIERIDFGKVEMHGVVSKRGTAQFGLDYAFESFKLTAGKPIPDFLLPLRDRLPDLVPIPPDAYVEALITEYQAGAGIGWHRDAHAFGTVVGISLLGGCKMRFRPYAEQGAGTGKRRKSMVQILEPRSAYVLQGAARTRWQHSIPAVDTLRYSITFRTLQR